MTVAENGDMDERKRGVISLDYHATTPVAVEVFAAMAPFFTEVSWNAHSVHSGGAIVSDAVSVARRNVADLIGAGPSEDYLHFRCNRGEQHCDSRHCRSGHSFQFSSAANSNLCDRAQMRARSGRPSRGAQASSTS